VLLRFCLGFFKSVRVELQRNPFGFAVGVCLRKSEAEDGVVVLFGRQLIVRVKNSDTSCWSRNISSVRCCFLGHQI
jgi:hypothetical protein